MAGKSFRVRVFDMAGRLVYSGVAKKRNVKVPVDINHSGNALIVNIAPDR
jgi:hypothetical protein